ncbi:MAG: AMMECR1 domain-containing protein [Deltaproteobacteria bacterium]|nr:MAG: AMMECR1 domain-containing protein [Deltaproteobacteria bacterium]
MEKGKLNGHERRLLLKIARQAIETELEGLPFSLPKVTNPNLIEHRGAFVTLHKHGQLRGCIGTFSANRPLCEVVGDMVISAAFKNLRFRPLGSSEFKEINLEISALTPLMPITDINEIKIGTHGIYIIQEPFHGVLLPQVATKNGWDRLTFLKQTCMKAGLASGCWKDQTTRINIFSAEIFGEKSEKLLS